MQEPPLCFGPMQSWLDTNSLGRTESLPTGQRSSFPLHVPGTPDLVVCFKVSLSDLGVGSTSTTQDKLHYLPAMGNHLFLLSFGTWRIWFTLPELVKILLS